MANFAGEGLPGDAVITTITEYKDGKWQWLFDYIIDLAVEAEFRLSQDLISGSTAAWRGSMHGFWNDMNSNMPQLIIWIAWTFQYLNTDKDFGLIHHITKLLLNLQKN